jgi:O-antigen ligase
MEYGIYLLVIFLFTDRGNSFRALGVYIPPVALICSSYLTRQQPFACKDPLFLAVVILCTSAIISAALSDETLSFLVWIKKRYLKAFLIFIVVSAVFKERGMLKKLIILLSILSPIFIAMTFYDYITKALAENGGILFDNVRDYNSILAFLLPIIPFALLTTRSKILKIFWILSLCIGFTALLLTGFRTGWISFIVSMMVWAVWFSATGFKKSIIVVIAGLVLTTFIVLSLLPSSHINMRIKQGLSTTYRYEWIWKPYIRMYSEFPLKNKVLGKGMTDESMYEYHSLYRKTIYNFPEGYIPLSPHNQYINILFRQGILGLALYINLIILYVLLLIKAIRKSHLLEYKAMGMAILCPFVGGYIVHGLVGDLRFMPLGLLVGMAGAYLNHVEDSNE